MSNITVTKLIFLNQLSSPNFGIKGLTFN